MSKSLPPRRAVLALAICLLAVGGRAQTVDPKARAAEWQSYKVPATPFARFAKTDEALLVFRVPVEWKRQGEQLLFTGGDGVQLLVVVETIPDGVPLRAYVASILESLRKLPGSDADTVSVRRTEMSGLEAREIMFDMSDPRGGASRRIIWSAVDGPRVVSFLLSEPLARAAEVEPYFKAVVESAIVSGAGPNILFELMHDSTFDASRPVRMDEALALVPALDSMSANERARATTRLTELFARTPESVIDLTIDRRAMVRAAAIEALAASQNRTLLKFLVRATNDPEVFVADRAAAALARLPDPVALLREETEKWGRVHIDQMMNATAYLDHKARAQIAAELFKAFDPDRIIGGETFKIYGPKGATAPAKRPTPPPPPPPAPRARARKGVTISETMEVKAFLPPEAVVIEDPMLLFNKQFIALKLLGGVPASEFKLPIDEIIAAHKENVIAIALQTAIERRESLPLDSLLKLLDSSRADVRRLAARSIGEAATLADLPRLEARAQSLEARAQKPARPVAAPPAAPVGSPPAPQTTAVDPLRAAIKMVRLREDLNKASGDARRKLLGEALRDEQIAEWVWDRFARDEYEGAQGDAAREPKAADKPGHSDATPSPAVAPFGENLFPTNVRHFVALPQPGATITRLVGTLTNLQMPTARSQADLVLLMNAWGDLIARFVGATGDGPTLDYLGIRLDAPIALASWTAADAPPQLNGAERQAVVVRVSDRQRFERFLTLYEKQFGNFAGLPGYAAVGTRFISLAPALLPLGAKMIMEQGRPSRQQPPPSRFNYVGRDACLGYEVKVVAQEEVKQGTPVRDAIYVAYVGDAAVLAPDWHSLHDALARLNNGGATVADNPDFKAAVAEGGDAIYFSNLGAVISPETGGHADGKDDDTLNERGSLRLTNAAWQNAFRLSFKAGDKADGTLTFQPDALEAPRRLLPRSTFAYLFLKLDAAVAWRGWLGDVIGAADRKSFAAMWAADFERDVLAELGPECGVALLGLPNMQAEKWDVPLVLFFKLKSDRLARAFVEGKLLNGAPAQSGVARVKWGKTEMLVTIRDGFLVIAADERALKRLDGTEKLAEARDYARAAAAAPDSIFAFGGYNLEAAVAEVASAQSDPVTDTVVNLLGSVARAFHGQNVYATAGRGWLEANMSVSLDREGRYSVAELSSQSKDFRPTFAIIEPGGVMIADQQRLESLKLRVRARTGDTLERLKADLVSGTQTAEARGDREMIVTVRPRRAAGVPHVELPVTDAEFAPFLKPIREIRSDDKQVVEQARQIAGNDRDAWSVARKLADWTYKNIRWKRVDGATAADTLATREADCVEFSQLFVAMARALGLPARIVSGMAYSGGSFGGHAWVEVYAGRWVELDPTWGTDFVDATHVRGDAGDLITYASLNLVDVEVVEAPHAIFDYERDPRRLADKICEELSSDSSTALTAALDAEALAEAHLGAGAWARLDEQQRRQLTAALPRVAYQLNQSLQSALGITGAAARVMKAHQNGELAEVSLINTVDFHESLIKLQLARRGAAWTLVDVIVSDTQLHVVKESLRPTLEAISAPGRGKPATYSDHQRAVLLMRTDPKTALAVLGPALQKQPGNPALLNLKAMALSGVGKFDDAIKLWTELGQGEPPFAPALYAMATYYEGSEEADERKRAVEWLVRYTALEPDDPRAHSDLAALYEEAGDAAHAGAEYRAALTLDPRSTDRRLALALWLAAARQANEAFALLDEGIKQYRISDDLVGQLMWRCLLRENKEAAEALAAARPERVAASADATLNLAYLRADSDHPEKALPLLQHALTLKKDNADAYHTMADVYRKLQNWTAALQAADAAIALHKDDGDAHYRRACALARLGRARLAMAALKRAIELDENLADDIAEEADLQSLARLPEFKALIPKEEPAKKAEEPPKKAPEPAKKAPEK